MKAWDISNKNSFIKKNFKSNFDFYLINEEFDSLMALKSNALNFFWCIIIGHASRISKMKDTKQAPKL